MGKTCIMKIMERAAGRSVQVGDRVWCKVDLASARDFGGANCVLQFEQEMGRDAKVWDPDKVAFTFDLQAPSHSEKVSNNQKIIREFAKRQGISYLFDINHGIGQHVMLEAGLVKPGNVILGTDSHMNLLGAVGAFATGVGNSDVAAAYIKGISWVPGTRNHENHCKRLLPQGGVYAGPAHKNRRRLGGRRHGLPGRGICRRNN